MIIVCFIVEFALIDGCCSTCERSVAFNDDNLKEERNFVQKFKGKKKSTNRIFLAFFFSEFFNECYDDECIENRRIFLEKDPKLKSDPSENLRVCDDGL